MSDPETVKVQARLAGLGFYGGKVDGIMGPETRKAIVKFQQAHAIPASAFVSFETWAALFPPYHLRWWEWFKSWFA